MITIDDISKIEIKIGKVLSADKVEKSEKLLKLMVDLGEEKPRQILSGIAKFAEPESLVGKNLPFFTNLETRLMMGLESQGMILAASNEDEFSLLITEKEIKPGTIVK